MNKCIRSNIELKDLAWRDDIEAAASIKDEDYCGLKDIAGHSYRITTISEDGFIPFLGYVKANILTVMGAFLLGALIFYQSLFIAEVRVDGYRALSETDIRQTLREAGIYEGAKKPADYSRAKAAMYEVYDELTWVSIYEDGRLIKVSVAEAGKTEVKNADETTPVDIVAEKSATVEKIMPLQGNAKVEKGDYVNKGDVLISGRFKYQSTDYSRGDDFYTMYSHAKGQVFAIAPEQVDFYLEKAERTKKLTGSMIPGIHIVIGDFAIDTAAVLNRYKVCVREETEVLDVVRPLPVKIDFVLLKEAEIYEERSDMNMLKDAAEAAVRQYGREISAKGKEIVSHTIDYSETEGLIRAAVFMEIMEDIGTEKEIKINKKEN